MTIKQQIYPIFGHLGCILHDLCQQKKIEAPDFRPFMNESICDRWISDTKDCNVDSISMLWAHHVLPHFRVTILSVVDM